MMRHGDLLIIRFDYLCMVKIDNKRKTNIVEHGEATGHAHAIHGNTDIHNIGTGTALTVLKPSTLEHEEHNTINLPEGQYIVNRQVQYNPFTEVLENVQD